MATLNAFDKIAKKSSETSTKEKVQAEVTDEIMLTVDQFVANKAQLKQLEATQKQLETTLIDHVRPQQDEMAYCGSFTKSLYVTGKVSNLTYVTMDKFTIPQDDESQTAIKKLVGKKFDEMFESKRFIAMKESAVKDESTLNKIAAACEKAGLNLADIFDVGDKIVGKDDLDRKQFELTNKQLITFRTLVRQAKPALK